MPGIGGQSMIARLRRVLVRKPDSSFAVADPATWHYTARPHVEIAREEQDRLVDLLRRHEIEVVYHDVPQPDRADAIYVFDPVLITDRGAVILRMGKSLRRGEEAAVATQLEELGIPIVATLVDPALAEGGDLLWLDDHTLFAGVGFRTNDEGVRQLREALTPAGIVVEPVDLPVFSGPEACLHLLSLISLVDHRLAVVYPPLLPVRLWQELDRRGFRLVEVPEEEFATMATNVLALAPGICLILEGNPITRRRLEDAGCTVHTSRGREISLKAEGGPTCLTRPLLRAD